MRCVAIALLLAGCAAQGGENIFAESAKKEYRLCVMKYTSRADGMRVYYPGIGSDMAMCEAIRRVVLAGGDPQELKDRMP